MATPNFSVLLNPFQLAVVEHLLDKQIHGKISREFLVDPQYNIDRGYTTLLNFHMMVCFLRGEGFDEAKRFKTELFEELSSHKKKIFFEFVIDPLARSVRLTHLIYNEKPARMGLMIQKRIMRSALNVGYRLTFRGDPTKRAERSYFYFT